ncbi:hypothetical protein POTOM_050179 [Populus tomentosa]|uniref:Uncharacterized protein n=1 Tax=Populus tomentosa TaxID=118781 RepID=A0A8X7Y3Q5_POPTO|nr:hypothetical protein POTOM_050179 [Populus tomentosa]
MTSSFLDAANVDRPQASSGMYVLLSFCFWFCDDGAKNLVYGFSCVRSRSSSYCKWAFCIMISKYVLDLSLFYFPLGLSSSLSCISLKYLSVEGLWIWRREEGSLLKMGNKYCGECHEKSIANKEASLDMEMDKERWAPPTQVVPKCSWQDVQRSIHTHRSRAPFGLDDRKIGLYNQTQHRLIAPPQATPVSARSSPSQSSGSCKIFTFSVQ